MRFRLIIILVGALLVAAVWLFPYWQPLLPTAGEAQVELFPGLARELQGEFAALPPERQRAYLDLAVQEPERALTMLETALSPAPAAPIEEQEMPELVAPTVAAVGTFAAIDPTRFADGEVTVYRDANGGWLLRFENFTSVHGPDLRVVLSAAAAPADSAEMRVGSLDLDLGPLKGVAGSQNYAIPPEVDLRQYRSVVLYSQSLDLIYSRAQLFIRSF